MVDTTWDSGQKTAGITLSGGDLVATSTTFNFNGVRSINGKTIASGGKYYFEVACNNSFSDNRSYVGFCGDLCTNGAQYNSAHNAGLNKPGTQMTAGFTPIATTFGVINNQTFGVAIDIPNKRFWVTNDGSTWNAGGTADPVGNVGGCEWTTIFNTDTTLHISCCIIDIGAEMTLNVGNTSFAYAVPAGFDAWDAVPDGNAPGDLITETVSLTAGLASLDGFASGDTLTVTESLTAGTAGISGSATGATLTATVSLSSAGLTTTRAIDGGSIFETTFGLVQANAYQEADYDSMFSKGRRAHSGLITSGEFGWSSVFAAASQGFDNNLGAAAGNGPAVLGPVGAYIWWHSAAALDLVGIRLVGNDLFDEDEQGNWEIKGAFGSDVSSPSSIALEWDAINVQQGPGFLPDTVPANNHYVTEWLFTPASAVLYDYWQMRYASGTRVGVRIANEIEFKIRHSNLDGGDRRATNGRPEKRCVFTMSADWAWDNVDEIDPQDALFDGLHQYENAGDSTKNNKLAAIGKPSATLGDPVTAVGAYLQFAFPRPVVMNRIMFSLFNTPDGEEYVGDVPQHFGTWHWEASKNNGASWIVVSGAWSFSAGGDMVAPRLLEPFDIDQTEAGVGENGVTHWRMVLDSGPAFGYGTKLMQIIFDLYDATGLAPTLTVNFTDDTDGVPVTITPGNPGSPYIVSFSDGSDDKLTLTVENIPNPLLTVAFDDGGTFDTWSDLYPSMVVQTIVNATGRR
jgi:hypothetical protein